MTSRKPWIKLGFWVPNFFDNRALFGMISSKDAEHTSRFTLATGDSTCQRRPS